MENFILRRVGLGVVAALIAALLAVRAGVPVWGLWAVFVAFSVGVVLEAHESASTGTMRGRHLLWTTGGAILALVPLYFVFPLVLAT